MNANMNGPRIHVSSWDEIPEEFRPIPTPPNVRKPLPPLPPTETSERNILKPFKKSMSEGLGYRCILSRLRRSKSESHHHLSATIREVPTWPAQTGFEAPWNFESPYPRTESSCQAWRSPSTPAQRVHSSQLTWMPEEQMWRITEGDQSSGQSTQVYHRRRSDEQQYRQTYPPAPVAQPFNDWSLSPFDPPPSYWSVVYPTARSTHETQWDFMARRLQRPSSAGP
jgi:hypothetical protein